MLKKMAGAVVAQNRVVGQIKSAATSKLPPLDDFLSVNDFTGAATLLDFELRTGDGDSSTLEWMAYASFHNGDYKRAVDCYSRLLGQNANGDDEARGKVADGAVAPPALLKLYKACCLYHMGLYPDAEAEAHAGLDCPLRTRLLYHCAHRLGKESALLAGHASLSKSAQAADALCLAAMHVARAHYQDAADVYKKLLLEKEHKEDAALHFYIALCYYRLDYYDVSSEILQSYLAAQPHSAAGLNLKACNAFRLYNGKAAEGELKTLADLGLPLEGSDLLRHNLVVFRGGEGAVRVLAPLVASGVISEARLNLAIHHLRNNAVDEAAALMKAVTPTTPQEYILTAVVYTLIGQRGGPGARDALKTATQAFQMVGSSPSEVDTIPGRCAMASSFFLARAFEDVSVYLGSVRPYLQGDDSFGWNYGLALAGSGNYRDAQEVLQTCVSAACSVDPVFTLWLARCYIMNRAPRGAWELYLGLPSDGSHAQASVAGHLLHLIGADCYSTGAWYFAAKAYDVLERMGGGDHATWEGKRGACAGVFAAVLAGAESRESLREIVAMLRGSAEGSMAGQGAAQQAQRMVSVISRWASANGGL